MSKEIRTEIEIIIWSKDIVLFKNKDNDNRDDKWRFSFFF